MRPDDEPAFPRSYSHDGHNGMTLRDYFAGRALTGMMSNPDTFKHERSDGPELRSRIAGSCYALADAMLEARK